MPEPLYPPVPPIAGEPLRIGGVTPPSRFFLAPLAGYTSLAFRLAVRACGGLGLATTDLVNARSLIENRRRALELSETNEADRPLAIQIYGHVVPEGVHIRPFGDATSLNNWYFKNLDHVLRFVETNQQSMMAIAGSALPDTGGRTRRRPRV